MHTAIPAASRITCSYIISHTPRCGSTLLCEALASTGMAGNPAEHFWDFDGVDIKARLGKDTDREALAEIYQKGMTANGVFGVKMGVGGPWFLRQVEFLRSALEMPSTSSQYEVIGAAFPNLAIICMQRRDKIRQAVSHWKAIQSGVWHSRKSKPLTSTDSGQYDFDAIDTLVAELPFRDAATQEFLTGFKGPTPMVVVYEDFIRGFEPVVRKCLDYLRLPQANVKVNPPDLIRLSDATNEHWLQQYRSEKQKEWANRLW